MRPQAWQGALCGLVFVWVAIWAHYSSRHPSAAPAPVAVFLAAPTPAPVEVAPALPSPSTGHLMRVDQFASLLPTQFTRSGLVLQSETYVEVAAGWVPGFVTRFDEELARRGLSEWSISFDCAFRASLFRDLAEAEYARAQASSQSSPLSAYSLAMVEVSYLRDTDLADARVRGWDGKDGTPHCPLGHVVIVILTERGLLTVDPTMGTLTTLSDSELDSVYLTQG